MRVAVVLFNLGGPDRLESVRPFLLNLFSDPAILRMPAPVRWVLARLITARRAKPAAEIYARLGGKSPLLDNTRAQAQALEARLREMLEARLGESGAVRVFVAMRYWHPMSEETAREVQAFGPDQIVLLPLYPQWSTATGATSVAAWQEACLRIGLDKPSKVVCCWPAERGWITAIADLIRSRWQEAAAHGTPRLLFSAHGLPERVVRAGDPYPWHCEQTAAAIVEELDIENLDWRLCYQSRVGPMKWIGPATEAEIRAAGRERVPLIVVPVAFVSEHSDTLVELDHDYRRLAEESGVPGFVRIATVGTSPLFIEGLARLVGSALSGRSVLHPDRGHRWCRSGDCGCAFNGSAASGFIASAGKP